MTHLVCSEGAELFTLVQAAPAIPMSTAESSPPLEVSLLTSTLVTWQHPIPLSPPLINNDL